LYDDVIIIKFAFVFPYIEKKKLNDSGKKPDIWKRGKTNRKVR